MSSTRSKSVASVVASKSTRAVKAALLERMARSYANEVVLEATDNDGVKSPFLDDPMACRITPEGVFALKKSAERSNVRVVFVTGGGGARTTHVLETSGVGEFERYCSYGVERHLRDQQSGQLVKSFHPRLPEARQAVADGMILIERELRKLNPNRLLVMTRVSEDAAANGILLFESKANMMALHYAQGLDKNNALERDTVAILKTLAPELERLGLHLKYNKGNVEVAFDLRTDKGTVIEELVTDETEAVVYMGDDLGDLDAMKKVRALAASKRIKGYNLGVLHAEETIKGDNGERIVKRGGSPIEVMELCDAVFHSEVELAQFMTAVVERSQEIVPSSAARIAPTAAPLMTIG